MAMVEPFTKEMLERYFADRELRVETHDEGLHRIQFGYANECDCELDYSFVVPNEDYRVLNLRGRSDKHFPAHRRADVLDWIDEFHRDRRLPLVLVREQGRRLRLETSHIVDYSEGTHAPLLFDDIDFFFSGTYDFWRFIAEKDR